jgi:DME family drug/metabolite transporter
MVALMAHVALGERLTLPRGGLAVAVTVGAALTVRGGPASGLAAAGPGVAAGVAGGVLAAASYAGTTVLARFVVPRLGLLRFLVLEIIGGTLILGAGLPLVGRAPALPPDVIGWVYVAALAVGTVWLANVGFFAALQRIAATPTAVAATIEPVVAALLALALFHQRLTAWGWIGLVLVVAGVAGGYVAAGSGHQEAPRKSPR